MNMPFRLNLEQQKKRSKELFKAFQNQELEAIHRFEKQHPKLVHQEQTLADFTPKLSDAQLVLARELGCKTWNQLRNHIALMDSLRSEVDESSHISDEPDLCLHIRCGSDIQHTLIAAGFKGDFLEFSDPLCVGPVSYDYDIEERAQFLFNSYGKAVKRDYPTMVSGLTNAYQTLRNGHENYQHVALWFEHDTYDQFIMIFLLSQFHRFGRPKNLWMVTTNEFPGSVRFQGLGQLPPEGLRLLWQTKQPVTSQQCEEADQHWAAFTDSNPKVFHQHIQQLSQTSLPYFKKAAWRQLQEQPIEQNQLPLTQQLTINLLTESSPQTAGRLFKQLMEQKEPLPFLGDIMYWQILQEMKSNGLIDFTEDQEDWPTILIDLVKVL